MHKGIKPVGLLLIGALMVLGSVTLWADDDFLPKLEQELYQYGYTQQETRMIMTAAREHNWQDITGTIAPMCAAMLQLCDRVRNETQAQEQVELVLHMAIMQGEMKRLGFNDREIARIAFNATREVSQILRTRTNAETETGNGEMIRERIRLELKDAGLENQEARIMEHIRARVQTGQPASERGFGPR